MSKKRKKCQDEVTIRQICDLTKKAALKRYKNGDWELNPYHLVISTLITLNEVFREEECKKGRK